MRNAGMSLGFLIVFLELYFIRSSQADATDCIIPYVSVFLERNVGQAGWTVPTLFGAEFTKEDFMSHLQIPLLKQTGPNKWSEIWKLYILWREGDYDKTCLGH